MGPAFAGTEPRGKTEWGINRLTIVTLLGALFAALSVAGLVYTLLAAAAVQRGRAARFAPAPDEPVSVLKPLHGADPHLAENLAALLGQDHEAPIQLILGVQDRQSRALPIAQRLKRDHPEAAIDIVTDERLHGPNRKISNLINMEGRIAHDLVILADSDIRIRPGYLKALTAACSAPGVGVVTCAYIGCASAGFWSQLAAMGLSYGFFPSVLLAAQGGLAAPVMGSTIALRRGVLAEFGGFAALADVLADDFEIGRLVTQTGRKAVLAGAIVEHECAEGSWSALFAQELRWAVTVRTIRPAGHLGSLVTHVLPLSLAAALLLGGWGWALPAAAGAARLWLMRQVDHSAGRRTGSLLLWPLRDMISVVVFVCSLFARSVRWRGARFAVSAGGRLSPG